MKKLVKRKHDDRWHTPTAIHELRSALQMDKKTFAKLFRLTKAVPGAWESGKKKPSPPATVILDILGKAAIEIWQAEEKYKYKNFGGDFRIPASESKHCDMFKISLRSLLNAKFKTKAK